MKTLNLFAVSKKKNNKWNVLTSNIFFSVAIEGWIVIVRNLHEETDEESLGERFMEYGTIKNIHLNLDRRTGYVKVRFFFVGTMMRELHI